MAATKNWAKRLFFLWREVWFFHVFFDQALRGTAARFHQGISDALPHRHSFPDMHDVHRERRQGRASRRLCRRQRRLQECGAASQPAGRRQGDGRRAAKCRLRCRRGHQPHPRQDDGEAARLRQEGAGRRRRGVLLRRPRHPRSAAPTICCRSMPTSNRKWTSSWARRSISISPSTRP